MAGARPAAGATGGQAARLPGGKGGRPPRMMHGDARMRDAMLYTFRRAGPVPISSWRREYFSVFELLRDRFCRSGGATQSGLGPSHRDAGKRRRCWAGATRRKLGEHLIAEGDHNTGASSARY